jgi:hypothetical protein
VGPLAGLTCNRPRNRSADEDGVGGFYRQISPADFTAAQAAAIGRDTGSNGYTPPPMHDRKLKVTLRGDDVVGLAPALEKYARDRGWKVHRQSAWSDAHSQTLTEMFIEQEFVDENSADEAFQRLREAIAEASTIAIVV